MQKPCILNFGNFITIVIKRICTSLSMFSNVAKKQANALIYKPRLQEFKLYIVGVGNSNK